MNNSLRRRFHESKLTLNALTKELLMKELPTLYMA